jgi:hypothetical protein
MFEDDPQFEQGTERARIFYDNGLQSCIDTWIAATIAMMAYLPPEYPEHSRAAMHRAVDRYPVSRMGKRP